MTQLQQTNTKSICDSRFYKKSTHSGRFSQFYFIILSVLLSKYRPYGVIIAANRRWLPNFRG
jgi:hypothetical protein